MAKTYTVEGMSCGGCAKSVTTAITEALPGATVTIDLEKAAVTVDGADDDAAVESAVEGAGFDFKGSA